VSSNRKSGDKSLFRTTILMLVPGSIKQRKPKELLQPCLALPCFPPWSRDSRQSPNCSDLVQIKSAAQQFLLSGVKLGVGDSSALVQVG
jgi:hypothetical protein